MTTYTTSYPNTREYAQVQLLDSLQSGHTYCVEFYVSLTLYNPPYSYAIDKIGAFLSNNAISSTSLSYLNYTAQVQSPTGTILSDSANWTLISGTYIALGGEKFITVGNFNNDANTDTLDYGYGYQHGAYYYIDDISVVECVTGISTPVANSKTSVYPNPFNSSVTIKFDNAKTELCTLTLYDLRGQIMRTIINISSDQVVIQKNDLQNGLYYFVLRTSDRVLVTGKLAVD